MCCVQKCRSNEEERRRGNEVHVRKRIERREGCAGLDRTRDEEDILFLPTHVRTGDVVRVEVQVRHVRGKLQLCEVAWEERVRREKR